MKNIRKYIAIFIALSIAAVAAFFSVSGIAKLFAGSSIAVMIMAGTLEVGKIITASLLEKHWNELKTSLKIYLSIGVLVLMSITSVGIYGFLSSAYQETAYKVEIEDGKLTNLSGKQESFQKSINSNEESIKIKSERTKQLSLFRNNQEVRLDSAKTNREKSKVRNDIEKTEFEIKKLEQDIDLLRIENKSLLDSIENYKNKSLEIKTGSELSGEVSSLKYLSDLTGQPMNKIVNWFILMLIFVFDPLAITLLIAAQSIGSNKKKQESAPKNDLNSEKKPLQNKAEESVAEQTEIDKNDLETNKEGSHEDFEKYYQEQLHNITKYKSKFIDLLDVLYEDGKVEEGQDLLNYVEFKNKVDELFINKFSGDDIKRFLTICNYLKITSLNQNKRVALMNFQDAKKVLENYLEK